MQLDCKLAVYAMLYSYRVFVSVSTEMVGRFFSPFPAFGRKNYVFSAKSRAPARPVFFDFCLHLFTFGL